MFSSARSGSSSAYYGTAWKDGTYGRSSANSGVWSLGEDCDSLADTERESDVDATLLNDETRQPLSRKVPVPPRLISPYRMVVAFRFTALGLFFYWRLGNPVRDAYWLWLTSVVCEIWLAMSWILEQLSKWRPVNRETYLERLALRYNGRGEPSRLAGIDVVVMAADPIRESPIMTANTLLSVLAVDYPVEKISCYISDDRSSMLTFDAVHETSEFARKWIPFCKKHCIEPRSPEQYFSLNADYLRNKVQPSFIKDRRAMKREYEEFKVCLNGLVARAKKAPREEWVMKDGTPWPGNNARDHPGIIQVFLGQGGGHDMDGNILPRLIYVSREIRPGFRHHGKAGAMNALVRVSGIFTNSPFILNLDCSQFINNSKTLHEAMCFLMDPKYEDYVAFVQFPLKFDCTNGNDGFADRNVFFDVNLRSLDGIQGPVYIGTACVFNRRCLYGYEAPRKIKHRNRKWLKTCMGRSRNKDSNLSKESEMELLGKHRAPERPMPDVDSVQESMQGEEAYQGENSQPHLQKLFGQSKGFIESVPLRNGNASRFVTLESLLREAIQVISCGYEDDTKWGREIGWIYGSGAEEFLVGLKVHARGWRSIYCTPRIPAFKGLAPISLADRLNRAHDWAKGSICILFSRHCPLWYSCGGRLKLLQRFMYINSTVYPLTALPLLAYCVLPSLCLFTGKFVLPQLDITGCVALMYLFFSILATNVLEMRWGGIGIHEWWRNGQFLVIVAVSAHLFAVFHGLIKALLNIDINICSSHDESRVNKESSTSEPYLFRWTSLLILPMALLMINLVAIVAGISSAISNGNQAWSVMFCKLVSASSVILHLHPFVSGLTSNRNRVPTIVVVWSVLLASIFSLLWLHVNPFTNRVVGPSLEQCGINC